MQLHYYVEEKLREFDKETRSRKDLPPPERPAPLLAPLARGAGRMFSRLGCALETWAEPSIRRASYRS